MEILLKYKHYKMNKISNQVNILNYKIKKTNEKINSRIKVLKEKSEEMKRNTLFIFVKKS